MSALRRIATFVAGAQVPAAARRRAAAAVLDTVGVTLAGASEPASRIVRSIVAAGGGGPCRVLGSSLTAAAAQAGLANGTAAHALDFDDMCFVSLAHPSAPLVPAALAAAESAGASGRALLDAYVVGFELEACLGRLMNPRHYRRGWHCTSTLGTLGSAAAASRLLGLDDGATASAIAIAASEASGLKENFGTMVKPLHAGLAAHHGIVAAQLAAAGLTASERALDGPQGFLAAMDSEGADLDAAVAGLGTRWELLETGITVKLYPSCAGTHPALDVILDLRREAGFAAEDVESIQVTVDSVTPTVLIHDRPATGLEAKFSMPFCAAAAVVHGEVGIATFEPDGMEDARVRSLMPRVSMRADSALDGIGPALTEARVEIRLSGGRTLARAAHGARGYAERPVSDDELAAKFTSCARRVLSDSAATRALEALRGIDDIADVRTLTAALIV